MSFLSILVTLLVHLVSELFRPFLNYFLQTCSSLSATFGATLKFIVKDCDPTTGLPDSDEGYDDEYMLEDFEITVADQTQKTKVNNFAVAWDSADTEGKSLIQLR